MQSRIVHHVTNEDTTVSRCLTKHFGLDDPKIIELFQLGAIYSDKKRLFEDRKLSKGAYLRIHLQPKLFPVDNVDWEKVIVHEEKDFVVVNKPFGIPVHATLDNNRDNLLFQLRKRTLKNLLVTARLDINVSGLLLLAKTPSFQRQFNQWLVERKVVKRYRAVVENSPPLGLQVHFMEQTERCPKRVALETLPHWQRCELTLHRVNEIDWLVPSKTVYEAEIELHTGRTHQIRAQLSALGASILGDRMYGSRTKPDFLPAGEAIALCSVSLGFPRWQMPPWCFQISAPWTRLNV